MVSLPLQRQTGKLVGDLVHHQDSVEAVAFNDAHGTVTSGGMDGVPDNNLASFPTR